MIGTAGARTARRGSDPTDDMRVADRIDAATGPEDHAFLVELLSERHPVHAGRDATTVARLRGYAMAAFERVGLPDRALLFLIEELESGIEAYPVAAATVPPVVAPRVSPSTMLGTAREELRPGEALPVDDLATLPEQVTPLAAPAPAAVDRKPDRAPRAKVPVRAVTLVDLEPAGAASPAPIVIAAPASVAAAVPPPPVERAPTLAASLAACAGNFFVRTACEQRTRAQFCEGKWGLAPQCPAGVANDHGQ